MAALRSKSLEIADGKAAAREREKANEEEAAAAAAARQDLPRTPALASCSPSGVPIDDPAGCRPSWFHGWISCRLEAPS
jgi:hypothetical protein